MFRRIVRPLVLAVCLAMVAATAFAGAPKYVFYFIGDGLGPTQRMAAELYNKMEKNDAEAKLIMNTFPQSALVTTYSDNTLITDSAAGGTALACGFKTTNGYIGKLPDGSNIKSIAEAAKENGYAVGIVTSTRLTHATPASFSAHNPDRNAANEIAIDQAKSGFDFFAGGGYRHFVAKDNAEGLKSKRKDDVDVVKMFADKGYKTFVGDSTRDAFRAYKPKKGEKVFAALTYSHLPYEVERRNSKMTENKLPALYELTEKAVQSLSAQDKPFFLMVEGGRIDHAAHAHDAKSTIMDTIAMDEAVKVAYDFYLKHPEETLIVTAADHETGGVALGISMDSKGYFLNLKELEKVQVSAEDNLDRYYNKLCAKESDLKKRHAAFIAYVEKEWGLTDRTPAEDKILADAMVVQDKNQHLPADKQTNYGYAYTPTMVAVTDLISQRARMFWTSFVHTGTFIPATSIGVGAEKFNGFIDNTDIPNRMAEVMEVKLSDVKHTDSKALLGKTYGPQEKYAKIPYNK
ncbi:alkaline phosphatase [Maridesulfovibrio salexigens]|uniref:Alkaline phosphatase n=1 Tax=Maridesulfovibrio salexigens (strain ATCC 14822 / DSM 2638 / NCIMB 8403 / VKM B-1763) TaxID=526222 RepID=C6BVD8_MARSD|nr:alkaline phosphatase [Maridesulfovibrio salexigens]ACS80113.1 Alkaline phosphatase [Maridesulfovibrio salexigens DSM 2638]